MYRVKLYKTELWMKHTNTLETELILKPMRSKANLGKLINQKQIWINWSLDRCDSKEIWINWFLDQCDLKQIWINWSFDRCHLKQIWINRFFDRCHLKHFFFKLPDLWVILTHSRQTFINSTHLLKIRSKPNPANNQRGIVVPDRISLNISLVNQCQSRVSESVCITQLMEFWRFRAET